MHRKLGWSLGVATAMLALFAAPAFPCAEDGLCGHSVFFSDDGEKFDLADLYDGETRHFGDADRQVKVTRTGDVVVMSFSDPDGGDKEFTCELETDNCYIITNDEDDSAKIMIMKSRHIEGAADHEILVMAAEGAMDHVSAEGKQVFISTGDAPLHWVQELEDGEGGHRKIIRVGIGIEDEGTLLRCPEGDSTLRLEEGEGTDGYYCPKHKVLLEVVKTHFGSRKLHEVKIHQD